MSRPGAGRRACRRRYVVSLILAGLVAALFASSSPAVPSPAKLIARGTSEGRHAATTARVTVTHPKAVYGRVLGRSNRSTFVIACTNGFDVSARTSRHTGEGVWELPVTRDADTCDVTARAAGSGRVVLEIRAL